MITINQEPFEHAAILSRLAMDCDHVTVWSNLEPPAFALLDGSPKVLECKVNDPIHESINQSKIVVKTQLVPLDTSRIASIKTDFLYTALSNSYGEAKAVLDNAENIQKFIAFQHYIPFWRRGSDRKPGVSNAFFEFQQSNPEWRPIYRNGANWGLVILSKRPDFFTDEIKWNPQWYSQESLDREDEERKAAAKERQEMSNASYARSHWLKLHRYAVDCFVWNVDEAKKWYREWVEGVPVTACNCKRNWMLLTSRNPPDFSNRRAFFRWTVDRHNDVNRKLGRVEMTLIEAKAMYGTPFS